MDVTRHALFVSFWSEQGPGHIILGRTEPRTTQEINDLAIDIGNLRDVPPVAIINWKVLG